MLARPFSRPPLPETKAICFPSTDVCSAAGLGDDALKFLAANKASQPLLQIAKAFQGLGDSDRAKKALAAISEDA